MEMRNLKCDLPADELKKAVAKALEEPVDVSWIIHTKEWKRLPIRKTSGGLKTILKNDLEKNFRRHEALLAKGWFHIILKRFAKILGWKLWQLSSVIHGSNTFITSLRSGHGIDLETFKNIIFLMNIDTYSTEYLTMLNYYNKANMKGSYMCLLKGDRMHHIIKCEREYCKIKRKDTNNGV